MLKLLAIIYFAFHTRRQAINWDDNFHLHPDERMIVMVTERIEFFNKLNPDFFNYGSLPIYILKGVAQVLEHFYKKSYVDYDSILKVGRNLSTVFDLGTIVLIYAIAAKLFSNKKIALLSAFFYTIAFFPIQNSHFFVVDVPLTFFSTLLIFLLVNYQGHPKTHLVKTLLIGVNFAAILATKFTGLIFFPVVILRFLLGSHTAKQKIITILAFLFSALLYFYIFMPYAFKEHTRFIEDIKAQSQMNSNPYIFPYTLQYVGTLPYLYYLKNIFLWGLGPIISVLSLAGLISIVRNFLSRHVPMTTLFNRYSPFFIFFTFYLFYFLVIGRSAVKFMRYMLPLYPFFAILAGYGLSQIRNSKSRFAEASARRVEIRNFLIYGLLILAVFWTSLFLDIYTQPHTRLAASEWIHANIPSGSIIALEHWDDGLPVRGAENYILLELTLYDQPDDDLKWQKQESILRLADYLIIASNRLYTPLQKLSDCNKYRMCYPKTAEYYKKLFSGQLPFKKVAEFSAYPGLTIGNYKFTIPDDSADESFTVYDHPKIMIFQKR